jgi:hypothetical protein
VLGLQLARTHPELVADHLPAIRAACAGKGLERVAELVRRGEHRTLARLLALLAAAAPPVLHAKHLPAVLDEAPPRPPRAHPRARHSRALCRPWLRRAATRALTARGHAPQIMAVLAGVARPQPALQPLLARLAALLRDYALAAPAGARYARAKLPRL